MKKMVPWSLVALGLLLGSPALAGPRDILEARKLDREAKALIKQGEFKDAAKKYKKADQLVPAPSYKLALARMLVELEDLVQAGDVLADCIEQSPRQWVEKKAHKDCISLASELEDRTPTLEIDVFKPSSDEVTITVDGEEFLPADGRVRFNPGKVDVVAKAKGYEEWVDRVKLQEGDHPALEITMKKKGGEDEKKEEDDDGGGGIGAAPAYISWGIGAAGLGVGIGFGIAAIQSTNDVLRLYGCENGECPPEAEADLNVAKTNGNVSTAGFVVGFVGVAAGTVLYLLAGDDSDDAPKSDDGDDSDNDDEAMLRLSATPLIGPGFVGVSGTF